MTDWRELFTEDDDEPAERRAVVPCEPGAKTIGDFLRELDEEKRAKTERRKSLLGVRL